ncbi:MAG: hypothetical protein LBB45_03335 [Methanobrevibacter sp.]|jgi:hypothetical protein|nr:hypothetical protein [Candidatus Methanovirga basalitermitum]
MRSQTVELIEALNHYGVPLDDIMRILNVECDLFPHRDDVKEHISRIG